MSTQEAIIEALSGYTVTSFKGRRPKATDLDTLEKELAVVAATQKTSLFEGGQRHGHLCNVISDEAYGSIIDDENFALRSSFGTVFRL